jgi:hypothetical protein
MLEVSSEGQLDISQRGMAFWLQFNNLSDEYVRFAPSSIIAIEGDRRISLRLVDDDGPADTVVLRPHHRGPAHLRVDFVPTKSLRLHFDHTFVRESGEAFAVPPLDVVREGQPELSNPNPAFLTMGIKLLGGALAGSLAPPPLEARRLEFLGISEGAALTFGLWTRHFELGVGIRAGNGRLWEIEVGLRPWRPWLTFLASYGIDWAQLEVGSRQRPSTRRLGHGLRVAVDVGFAGPEQLATDSTPSRGGFFLSAGPMWLSVDPETVNLWVMELGFRLRIL